MDEVSFYLDDFTDEVLPCGTTLEEWAEWLSKPDKSWPHDIPKHGDTFNASRVRWAEDIVATRDVDGDWSFSRELVDEPSVLAVRFGPGLGWDPDNILWWTDGATPMDALRAFLSDPDSGADAEEFVAVGYDEPPIVLTYVPHPPRLIIQETRQ